MLLSTGGHGSSPPTAAGSVAKIPSVPTEKDKDKDQETVANTVGPEQRVNRQKWPGRSYKREIKQDSNLWHAVKDLGAALWPVRLCFPHSKGSLTTLSSS